MGTWPNCATFFGPSETFSTDPGTAYSQGQSEAGTAEADAAGVGAVGTPIYYDLESYDSPFMFGSYTCGEVVASFVEGWVSQLPAYGYAAAVYATSQNAEGDIWTAYPQPTDIWVARYDARATVWGLDYQLAGGLSDTTWSAGFRAKQFVGNAAESYGGSAAYSVDRDLEYAQVGGGNGTKPLGYQAPADVDVPGASDGTSALGVDWTSQVAGTYAVPNPSYPAPPGAEIGYGFLDDPVSGYITLPSCGISTSIAGVNDTASIEYVGGYTDSSGATHGLYVPAAGGCTTVDIPGTVAQVSGVNDDEQVVGWYRDANQVDHGFIYNARTGVITSPLDYPGAAQTVLEGINGLGQITGTYTDSRRNTYPFIYQPLPYQPQTGTWSSPLSSAGCKRQPTNNAFGINNNDLVALDCYYFDAVFDYAHGADITTVSYPGSLVSRSPSLSDLGLLAGVWADSKDTSHGFLATPKIQ